MCAALTCGVVQCNRGNGPPQAMDFSPQGFTQSLNITQSGENGTSVGTWTAAAPVNHRFDFIQTLYFTLTSFSTVGYATLQPRDPGQRLRGQHASTFRHVRHSWEYMVCRSRKVVHGAPSPGDVLT